jgi:hypothetical protein
MSKSRKLWAEDEAEYVSMFEAYIQAAPTANSH